MRCPISDEDEQAFEQRLGEELDEIVSKDTLECGPVPLLTPPSSPKLSPSEESEAQDVCEWPYNLTVDAAMTSAIALRPLSPKSLQLQEDEICKRIVSFESSSSDPRHLTKSPPPSITENHSTGLTPKLLGISV